MFLGGLGVYVSSPGGMAAKAGSNFSNVSSACCHWHLPLHNQAQNRRIHDKTPTAPARDIASVESADYYLLDLLGVPSNWIDGATFVLPNVLVTGHDQHPLMRVWILF